MANPPPPTFLPPLTTSKNSIRAAATGMAAKMSGGKVRQESDGPPGALSRADIDRMVLEGAAQEHGEGNGDTVSPSMQVMPRKVERRTVDPIASLYDESTEEAPQPGNGPQVGQRFTLAQLAERVAASKTHRRQVAESGDPDGDDAGGYDPSDIAPARTAKVQADQHGVSMAASVVGSMYKKRTR